jgi:hypothetical protein
MWPPFVVQGHHLHDMQYIVAVCPFFVHPLCQLEMVIVCSFWVAFECCRLFWSDFEVMNCHGVEKKEVTNK